MLEGIKIIFQINLRKLKIINLLGNLDKTQIKEKDSLLKLFGEGLKISF